MTLHTDQGDADPHEEVRAAVLKAALPNVAFDGWTEALLANATRDAGLPPGELLLAFPNGASDLIDYFMLDGDQRMEDALLQRGLSNLGVTAKIELAIRLRLEVDKPNREALRRAITLLVLPISAASAARALYRTVDRIWRIVGDTSTDFNFYTKRAILAGMLSSTTSQWLADQSAGSAETWAFLERRMQDVVKIERAKSLVRKGATLLPDPLRVLGWLRYRRG